MGKHLNEGLNAMLKQDAARNAYARKAFLIKQHNYGDGKNSFPAELGTGSTVYVSDSHGRFLPPYCSTVTMLWGYEHELVIAGRPTSTNQFCEIKTIRAPAQSPSAVVSMQSPIVTPSEMLNIVRDTFMLNVSDASRVFRVSRPTIYQWGNLTEIGQVRARHDRERLKELYRLSLEWSKRGKLTGRWASQVLRIGQSVIDLLSAEKIDHQVILDAHAQLRAASESLRQAELLRSSNAVKAMGSAFDRLATNEAERKRGSS